MYMYVKIAAINSLVLQRYASSLMLNVLQWLSNIHSNLSHLHPANRNSCRYEKRRANRTTDSGEHNRVFE